MWTLILVSLLGVTPSGVEVQTLDGRHLAGRLDALTAQQLVIQAASGRQTLQTGEVSRLTVVASAGSKAQVEPRVRVQLIDGSSLAAADYTADHGRAVITLAGGTRSLRIATSAIAAVQFLPSMLSPSAAEAAEWLQTLERPADSDRLIVRKGDAIDEHQGILREVTAAVVGFEVDGELLPVKREGVSGLIYYHAVRAKLPEAACYLSDVDGTRWAVQTMRLADDTLEWSTPTGLTMSRPLAELKRIEFSGGKVVYLSDLQPESAAWSPYFRLDNELPILNQFYAPRQDHTWDNLPLALGGKQYPKGLAVQGRTELTYRLPNRFRRFQAVVGIDDRVRSQGAMRLLVRGDQRVLWKATLAGGDAPRPLDLDVDGVRRLSLLADFSGSFAAGDHLLLCDAKVIQ